MGDSSFVQTSFHAGEWSKTFQGRYDRPDYRMAMNVCLNGLPIETGSWVRRPGFKFAGTTRSGNKGRVIKFDFQANAPYMMELTDIHLRFFSGARLVTTNDAATVTSISGADPAVVTLSAAVDWATGDQAYFLGLGTTSPLLQNRVLALTALSTTEFSLTDAVTGETIDGATLGWTATSGVTLNRALDISTPYGTSDWTNLRSVQTEHTAVLLTPRVAPYALNVTRIPDSDHDAEFELEQAVFMDGPYLDPFTNGVQANAASTSGLISVTLSFPTYSSSKAYAEGAFVTSSGSNYRSLVDENLNHTPASSPAYWEAVSAGEAIGPNGFTGSDIGRQVRFFSEPPLWASGTTYNQNDVVSYNPTGLPGGTTYWSSKVGSNTGNAPGKTVQHWELMSQGAAIWTWGRITALSNVIAGDITGSVNIGDMVESGGLAGAFDGTFFKAASLSATEESVGGALADFATVSQVTYVGKDYSSTGSGGQQISQVTVYPSSDKGFAFGTYTTSAPNPGDYALLFQFVLNMRASQTAPLAADDGTVLGTSGAAQLNTLSPITIVSNDPTTSWNFVWIEVRIDAQVGRNVTATHVNNVISQVIFFSPAGTDTSAGVTVELLGPALIYSSAIREWRLGVYSDATGWPTCGSYHEGRIWLSGAVPNRIDASVSNGLNGKIINFAPTDQYGNVLASSGIAYTFNAPDANPIFWMQPDLQGLICGTKAGEWLVQAPTTGPISATNIAARRITGIGAANIEPRRTEQTTVFVQKYGRKLMEYFADAYSGKFTAPNLSLSAKHLTRGGISEIAYQQELAPTLWYSVGGALRGCTYKRDAIITGQAPTIVGHHRHTLGSSRTIESMAVGPSVGGDVDALTIVTKGADDDIRHVEVLTDILDEDATLDEAWYLDNSVEPSSSSEAAATDDMPFGGLTLNGLWHLNGHEVTAWLGGLDCGDYEVEDGSITVPYGDGISSGTGSGLFTSDFVAGFDGDMPMVVGFTYTSDGQIVRPVSQQESGARNGPAFGKLRRAQRYAVQLQGAVYGTISFGTTFDNILPALLRQPGGADYAITETFDGIHRDRLEDPYSFDTMLCWRITRPYPAGVVAIGPALQTQDD